MARNQISFFATKADLESFLRAVESEQPLWFAVAGMFDAPTVGHLDSLLAVSGLGSLAVGDPNHAPTYLAAKRGDTIEMRSVPQRRGGVRYAIDQLANPRTLGFRPAGTFGARCVVASQMGTASDDENSLALFRAFGSEMRNQFSRIKSFYVGPEAVKLLDEGWRLTSNTKSPIEYDLTRD